MEVQSLRAGLASGELLRKELRWPSQQASGNRRQVTASQADGSMTTDKDMCGLGGGNGHVTVSLHDEVCENGGKLEEDFDLM